MATTATQDQIPCKSSKDSDPLASHLIPELIDDRRYESEGRTLSYRRGKLLGKGGFAKVFASTLLPGRSQYAIKIVAKCSLQKARAQQKLQTEIKIHKALRHVNVVKFERCFDDQNFYFIVMELCDNNSMAELLKRRKKLSEPETRFYLSQIVESLQYLHSHLVIHRDLKLGNLFIDANMCIKVGDFGLATHLTHPDERRKTICGTPNYIAPEILEGKTGHSFEVDIWSTGVILYTLLVGKPPFESKDVKSTYKRILANSYTFPDHAPVSSDAKNLIRKMLQGRPELRPPLKHIAAHPFFTRPTAYMPTTLPESALHECPRQLQMNDFVQSSAAYALKEDGIHENYFAADAGKGKDENNHANRQNNENDPTAMNRMNMHAADQGHLLAKDGGDAQRGRSGVYGLKSSASTASNGTPTPAPSSALDAPSLKSSSASTAMQMMSSARPSGVRSQSTAPLASAAAVYSTRAAVVSAAPSLPVNAAQGLVERTKQNPYASTTAASSSARVANAPKFDIYVDSKPTQSIAAPSAAATAAAAASAVGSAGSRKRDASGAVQAEEGYDRRAASRGKTLAAETLPSTLPAPALGMASGSRVGLNAGRRPTYELEIDQINTEFEHVQLAEPSAFAPTSKPAVSTPPAVTARDAWAWNHTSDEFPTSRAVPRESARVVVTTPLAHSEPLAPAAESEAMCISTPQDQVMSSKECKPLGTLEAMHDMLKNNSFSVADGAPAGGSARARWSQDNIEASSSGPSSSLVAKVWVVRYVDYTSKYGLGFLFNTGSAGVYFNDSTKIVLSADGTVFQYTERRRRDSSNASEHSSQKHLINCYPQELQKKVTLLKHFRNYLVDQQKNSGKTSCGDDGNGGNPGLIREGVISDGASTSVKFGHSSTRYNSVEENNYHAHDGTTAPMSPLGMMESEEEDQDMPFLKKWVRTKHAILFRISNRTVQVVFYDRSEVLLSSEARTITYVSKQGQRSEHSLDDVLQTGRVDIAKRLKYTKDIMYRLINTQSK